MFFKKQKYFLNMNSFDVISHSVVILDNKFNNIDLTKSKLQIPIKIDNPFEQLTNKLVLKSQIAEQVTELPNSDKVHREFLCNNNIIVKYDFFPPRLEIKHNTKEEKDEVKNIANKLIKFADINDSIGALGINYELFIANDKVNVITSLLKDSIAKEFDSISATLVFNINDNRTLNLRIADANIDGKKGIYFHANFHNNITDENKISNIFKEDLLTLAKEKIETIINQLKQSERE